MAANTFDGAKVAAWYQNSPSHSDNASDVAVSWAKAGTAIRLRAYHDDTALTGNPRSQLEALSSTGGGDPRLPANTEYWCSFLFRYSLAYSSPGWNSPYETYGPPYAGSPPWAIGHDNGTNMNLALNTGALLWTAPQSQFAQATPRRITFHSYLSTSGSVGYLEFFVDGVQQLLGGVPRRFFPTLDFTNNVGPQHYTIQVYHQNLSAFPDPVEAWYGDFMAGATREIAEGGGVIVVPPPPVETAPLASTFTETFDSDGLANFPAERRVGTSAVGGGVARHTVTPTAPYSQLRSIYLQKFQGLGVVYDLEATARMSVGTGEPQGVFPTIGFRSRDGIEADGTCRVLALSREVAGVQQLELRVVEDGNDLTPYVIASGSLPVPLSQMKSIKTVFSTDGQTIRWLYSTNGINFSPLGISRKFTTFNFTNAVGYIESADFLGSPSSNAIVADQVTSRIYTTSQVAPNPTGAVAPGNVWRSFGSNARIVMQADTNLLRVDNSTGGLWLAWVGMRDVGSVAEEWAIGIQIDDSTPGLSLRVGKTGDTDADFIEFVPGSLGGAAFGSPVVKWAAGKRGLGLVGCDSSGRLSSHFIDLDTGTAVHARNFATIPIPAVIPTTNAKVVLGGPRASNTTDAWHGFGVAGFYGGGVPSDQDVESMASVLT